MAWPAKKEKPVCSRCNGSGSVTKWTTGRDGKRISYETSCDKCDGTGYAW